MLPNPHIRPATVDDARAIAQIHISAWQAAYRSLVSDAYLANMDLQQRQESWAKQLAAAQHPVLVAQSGTELSGWAGFGTSRDSDAAPTTGEIYGIYLAPDHWRNGIGTRLFTRVTQALAQMGFSHVSLWVLQDNPSARSFYERMGLVCEALPQAVTLGGSELLKVRYHGPIIEHGESTPARSSRQLA